MTGKERIKIEVKIQPEVVEADPEKVGKDSLMIRIKEIKTI